MYVLQYINPPGNATNKPAPRGSKIVPRRPNWETKITENDPKFTQLGTQNWQKIRTKQSQEAPKCIEEPEANKKVGGTLRWSCFFAHVGPQVEAQKSTIST